MYYELSKPQKKIARIIMDKGLDVHYRKALLSAEAVIKKWQDGTFEDTRAAYMQLYKTVEKNDNHIAWIYNDKGGSRYVEIMALQLKDKVITVNDLAEFDEDVRNAITRLSEI